MVEKGLGKEDIAVAFLFDFPVQIVGGYFIARWSRGNQPLRPWMLAFWPRLLFALLAAIVLWKFPPPPITTGFFVFIILFRSLGEMARQVCFLCSAADAIISDYVYSTTQWVCICAFHARISDPVIGGTYITVCAAFFPPCCFHTPNPTSSLTLLQISAALGLDSLFYEVSNERVSTCVEFTNV